MAKKKRSKAQKDAIHAARTAYTVARSRRSGQSSDGLDALRRISRSEPIYDENTDIPPFTKGWIVFEESDASDHNDPMGKLKDMLNYTISGEYGGLVEWIDQKREDDNLASPIYKVEGKERIPTNPNHVVRAIYKHPHTIPGWKPRIWVAPGASIPLIKLKIKQGYKIWCALESDNKKIFDISASEPEPEPEPDFSHISVLQNPRVTQFKSPLIPKSVLSREDIKKIPIYNNILPFGSKKKKKKSNKKINKKKRKKTNNKNKKKNKK